MNIKRPELYICDKVYIERDTGDILKAQDMAKMLLTGLVLCSLPIKEVS